MAKLVTNVVKKIYVINAAYRKGKRKQFEIEAESFEAAALLLPDRDKLVGWALVEEREKKK